MNNTSVAIPVRTSLFIELANFLRDQGSDRDPVQAVEDAIYYWIDNASWKQEDLLPEIYVKDKGYTWKEVFLPHATSIRMKYKSEYHYAQVDGDDVVFEGGKISPSAFANKVAGSPRNAWRDLEIRRPDDDEWVPADHLRESARALRAKVNAILEGDE